MRATHGTTRLKRVGRIAIAAGALAGTGAFAAGRADAAAIASGDLLVCRVGTGTGSLVNTGNPVFLDEYTPTGTLVQSIPMPTAVAGSNKALVASGTATSECLLSRTPDGKYVLLTGYNSTLPAAASLSGTTSATVSRTIGLVDATGAVNTTTSLTDAASGNNPRSATSSDGTTLWIAGGAGGIRTATVGASTSSDVSSTVANIRQISIFGGQLFGSTSSGTAVRVGAVGTGLPTTTGTAFTNLPGIPTTGSPYSFFFADLSAVVPGNDTLYVADDTPGTIQKFSLVAGTWVANGTITATGVRGLTGVVTGTSVALYGTTGGSTATGGGTIYSAVDATGYNATATATASSIATAAANTAFRGIALAPINVSNPVVPEAPWAILLPTSAALAGAGFLGLRRLRTRSILG